MLTCPVCHQPTDRLKQYRYIDWLLFLGVAHVSRMAVYRSCPGCMRRKIWTKCLINVPPANLMWFFVVLPATVFTHILTMFPGHSKNVLMGVTPNQVVAAEQADFQDFAQTPLRWNHYAALLALGLGAGLWSVGRWMEWAIPVAVLAGWVNRKSHFLWLTTSLAALALLLLRMATRQWPALGQALQGL